MRATPVTRREMLHFLVAGAIATFSAGYPRLGFAAGDDNFRAIYLDPRLREQFFLFLENVFHLYPEQDFHDLIARITRAKRTDREIYEAILAELPSIKPFLREVRYSLRRCASRRRSCATRRSPCSRGARGSTAMPRSDRRGATTIA
jgi:hypothetical protein